MTDLSEDQVFIVFGSNISLLLQAHEISVIAKTFSIFTSKRYLWVTYWVPSQGEGLDIVYSFTWMENKEEEEDEKEEKNHQVQHYLSSCCDVWFCVRILYCAALWCWLWKGPRKMAYSLVIHSGHLPYVTLILMESPSTQPAASLL